MVMAKLKDLEVLFSTWGMPTLTPEQIALFPSLKAVFYAAGSVKGFAGPFLDKGIAVVSAWRANAIPVAEFTLAQILLSCKGYFRNSRDCRDPELRLNGGCHRGRGVFGEKIGLIGCGMIARHLIGLLKPFNLKVLVYDPYLSEEDAAKLGVEKADAVRIFKECFVVSNHLPNLPSLRSELDKELFSLMREGATFINTGRGAQVDEAGLIAVMKKRDDLTALLDVTDPEPPPGDSPFYKMPNVRLSSHIAGSLGDEVVRMADYVIEDFERWDAGLPLQHAVSKDMLDKMA
jgi:phosphoglycerate dehydrogenase-like enzyme